MIDNLGWYISLLVIYITYGSSYILTFGFNRNRAAGLITVVFLFACLIFAIAKPVTIGRDTVMYHDIYNAYASNLSYEDIPIERKVNYLFFLIGKFSAIFSTEFWVFQLLITSIFLYLVYKSFRMMFGELWHLAVLVLSSTFIFYGYLLNLLRNSLVVGGVFIVLYLFYFKPTFRKRVVSFLTLAFLTLIHSGAGFVGLSILLSTLMKNEKQALLFWMGILIISIFGVAVFKELQSLIINFDPTSSLAYKTSAYGEVVERTGFRLDFVLYTLTFGLMGYFISINWKDDFYKSIVKWYLVQGSFFMMMFDFPNVDRIASLAWQAFPILIGYPVLYWRPLKRHRLTIIATLIAFGILNLIMVAKYDFNLSF